MTNFEDQLWSELTLAQRTMPHEDGRSSYQARRRRAPRGRLAADPPGTWSDPTWQALHFPTTTSGFAFADDDPHAFSFAFESALANARSSFIARACGDLDGDGARSTFEVRGHDTQSEGAVIEPGMYVEAPLE